VEEIRKKFFEVTLNLAMLQKETASGNLEIDLTCPRFLTH
jgi:hypothetical protein